MKQGVGEGIGRAVGEISTLVSSQRQGSSSPASENKMYKPEATINILEDSLLYARQGGTYYKARGMEQRIKRCCSGNPECLLAEECRILYNKFVMHSADTKKPRKKHRQTRSSPINVDLKICSSESYRFYGPKDLTHENILRC